MRDIHDRMPLVLPASEWDAWLDPQVDPGPLLTPPSEELVAGLELRPIGPRVGAVANDDPELLQRVEPIGPAVLL
jgi:putative SOS response-associated peptidase YedK